MPKSALQLSLLAGCALFVTSCAALTPAGTASRSPADPPVDCLVEQMKFTEGYIPSPLCNR